MIETTGLADPAPVAQTFFADDDLKDSLRLDAILTVVDAKHVIQHLDEEKPDGAVNEAVQQVAFADKILLNKIDLVSEAEKQEVYRRITEINRGAEIIECQHAAVPLDHILAQHAFDLDRILTADPSFLQVDNDLQVEHEHEHHHHDGDKGCEACAEGDHSHHHEHDHDHTHGHHHDSRVSSVGIEMEGSLDMGKLNAWLGTLLQERGQDIYRCKGILSVTGSNEKFVFHGVHMMLQFGSSAEGLGRPWGPDEARICRAVFIGKELDRQALTDGLRSCLAA